MSNEEDIRNQEDPMRTTVKLVHQRTPADGETPQRPRIERWLFGAMFLWPIVVMVSLLIHEEFANFLAYSGSTIFATILAGIALCNYPASRRFLKWLAGIILLVTLRLGVMAYWDSLYHGFWWAEHAKASPIFWLYVLLVDLSIIYLVVPEGAWGWIGDGVKRLCKRARHGRSI